MSLDSKTSHLGRPGFDELVPSRYALRVGEIDVLVISDGVFPLQAATLATNADPADLAAWLDDRLQPPDVYQWPLNVVVVRSGGRTVLIDSGVGSEFPDFPHVGRLATAIGRISPVLSSGASLPPLLRKRSRISRGGPMEPPRRITLRTTRSSEFSVRASEGLSIESAHARPSLRKANGSRELSSR